MRVNFVGRVARVHSGYIRIKTNHLAEDEVLVLPVLVEVTRSECRDGREGGREGRGGEGRGGGRGGEGRGEGRGGEGVPIAVHRVGNFTINVCST